MLEVQASGSQACEELYKATVSEKQCPGDLDASPCLQPLLPRIDTKQTEDDLQLHLLKFLMSMPLIEQFLTRFKLRRQAEQEKSFIQPTDVIGKQAVGNRSGKQTVTDKIGDICGGGVHGVVFKSEKDGYWLDGGFFDEKPTMVPFGDTISQGLLQNPDLVILKDVILKQEIMCKDFLNKMNLLSTFLQNWERLKKGDIILFYVSNSIETMLFFTACFHAGIVPANASVLSSPESLIQMCGTSIIFTESALLDRVLEAQSILKQPLKIILRDGNHKDYINLQEILSNQKNSLSNENINHNCNKNSNNNKVSVFDSLSNTDTNYSLPITTTTTTTTSQCAKKTHFNNLSHNGKKKSNRVQTKLSQKLPNGCSQCHSYKEEDKVHEISNNSESADELCNNNGNDFNSFDNISTSKSNHTNNNNHYNNTNSNNTNNHSINNYTTGSGNNRCSSDISVDDLALVIFSSGTTGVAKAIKLTHRNLQYQLTVSIGKNVKKIQAGQVVFAPLNHLSGSIIPLFGIATATPTNLLTKFNVDQYLGLLAENKLESVFTVPRVLNEIVKNADLENFNKIFSLKEFVCGTAPLAPEIAEQLIKKIPNLRLRGSYGLTEISGMCTVMPNDVFVEGKSDSVGIPLPSVQIKIKDVSSGSSLGPYKNGEVMLRSPMLMEGYLEKRPNLKPANPVDHNGWLHTGDLGYFDEHGHLFIVDRIKEIITCHGHQISPLELESLLMKHDDVIDAGVFGVDVTATGSALAAWVVVREGVVVSEKELVDFVAANAPPFKWLEGGVDVVDKIPRSASGKIIRREMIKKKN